MDLKLKCGMPNTDGYQSITEWQKDVGLGDVVDAAGDVAILAAAVSLE
jgi:hypothetical protein